MTCNQIKHESDKMKVLNAAKTLQRGEECHELFYNGIAKKNTCIYVYRSLDGFLVCFVGRSLEDCKLQSYKLFNGRTNAIECVQ